MSPNVKPARSAICACPTSSLGGWSSEERAKPSSMRRKYLFAARRNEASLPVDLADVAQLQVLLEGVPLPNERSSLLRYALHEGATGEQIALLQRLPERRYDNIDEVAEELVSVQPRPEHEEPESPDEESGAPPGGETYTQPHPESGRVRDIHAA